MEKNKRRIEKEIIWKIAVLAVFGILLLVSLSATLMAQTWGQDIHENDSYRIYIDDDDDSGDEVFAVWHDFQGTGTELFRVGEDGNVGINIDNPNSMLHVNEGAVTIGYPSITNPPDDHFLVVETGIGIGVEDPKIALDVQTGLAAIAGSIKGVNFEQEFQAGANNDVMTALYIKPTFTDYSYTGVKHYGLILESGGVGIGTTAPDRALEINSVDGNNLRLTYNDNDGSAANYADFSLASDGALLIQTEGTDPDIEIRTENFDNAIFIDDVNHKVGIGTNNPYACLDVTQSASIATTGEHIDFYVADHTLSAAASFTNQRFSQFKQPTIDESGMGGYTVTNAATVYIEGAPIPDTVTITNPYAFWIDAGVSRFDGNVGIGTTNPGRRLHVATTGEDIPAIELTCDTDTTKSAANLYIPIEVNNTIYYLALYSNPP